MAEQQILAAPQGFGDSQPAMQPAGQMPANAAAQPLQQNGAQQGQLPAAQSAQPAGLPSLREVLAQPLVRRSIPPILALFTLFFFVMVYFWVNEGNLRALYPNMSEADRKMILQIAREGAQVTRARVQELERVGIDQLRSSGMQIRTLSTAEKTAFQDALKPAYAEFGKRFGQANIDAIRNAK